MLALLADDRANEWNEDCFVVVVKGQTGLGILEGAEDDISEGASEVDGGVEVSAREDVLTGLNWRFSGTLQDAVCTEIVEFFLGLDCGESVEDNVSDCWASDLEAGDVVRDVLDQAGEEGNLEELVECDELEDGLAGVRKACRQVAIW